MADRSQILNDQEEAMRLMLEGNQVGVWTAIPGIITALDFTRMTCSVQPAIQAVVENETGELKPVNLPVLINVPLVFPSGGGFTITLPLAINDEVLVVFSSRCVDAWWQSGGIQQAMEARMHDLSDGFAIPGPKSLPNVISGISSTGLQVRNNVGTTYLEIAADGKIKLVSPAGIYVTGDIHVTGDVIAGTVSLKNHEHPVITAPGTTGPPIP